MKPTESPYQLSSVKVLLHGGRSTSSLILDADLSAYLAEDAAGSSIRFLNYLIVYSTLVFLLMVWVFRNKADDQRRKAEDRGGSQ